MVEFYFQLHATLLIKSISKECIHKVPIQVILLYILGTLLPAALGKFLRKSFRSSSCKML